MTDLLLPFGWRDLGLGQPMLVGGHVLSGITMRTVWDKEVDG